MEGIPIGRKIDLYTHRNYDGLIQMLCHMFKTTIHTPGAEHVHNDKSYLLTYEDKEGDWMMVGDVPWDFFLTTVKKLQISRADKC
ncbi:Auxin-responsive protein iaa20 [Thalictrum thalictroides]|uniref:Auxin-responsive protein n=1 Tax=Thalictrum thalictroides TaxID=46969 RepID=A0A7J6UUD7_THATH|nr:Auxin-responsive protein iaa20 [Thalictrum thalictroides]